MGCSKRAEHPVDKESLLTIITPEIVNFYVKACVNCCVKCHIF